jgi:signal transduction histidine kinase/ABC-type amino acid transport substrate-binding protein
MLATAVKTPHRHVPLLAALAALLLLMPCRASAQESLDLSPDPPRPLSDTDMQTSPAEPRRVVIFGGDHDGAPMEYLDASGNPAGFNVDLMRAIGDAMDLEVHFILSRWPDIRRGIMGDEDMEPDATPGTTRLPLDVAALYYLSERERFVDYSGSFLIEYSDIFVTRQNPAQVNVADPGTLKVGIMRGGYTYDYFKANHPGARFVLFDAETEALRQLNAGGLDAAIVGQHTGRFAMRAYGLSGIRPEGKPFLARQYCLAVRKDDADLRDILNQGLEKIRASGKYEEIYQRWFGANTPAKASIREILGYLGIVAAPLVLVISAVLVWNASLKRKVASRTEDLSKELAERRHIEDVLRESESRFKELTLRFGAILEGIPQSITLLDRHGEILWTDSARGEPLDGQARKPAVHCCRLAEPRKRVCRDCVGLAAINGGLTVEAQYQLLDGRTLEVRAVPMRGPDNEPQALVMTSDITEKTLLQQEAMRASHLASLGELSAGVAHEINNPGGLILFNLPFLQQAFEESQPLLDEHFAPSPQSFLAGLPYARAREEIPQVLTTILESARRIRRIVEDLRNFARPSSQTAYSWVDLRDVADTALRLTGNTLRKASAVVTVDMEDGLPPIYGNQHLLEQVLVNLLLNAGQALTGPGQAISVRAWQDPATSSVVLEVRDQGRGMPPDVLAHVTDPFFTTRRDQGGTGLGLSMTARILKEHKAELRILSQPGKGAAFIMTFQPRFAGRTGEAAA